MGRGHRAKPNRGEGTLDGTMRQLPLRLSAEPSSPGRTHIDIYQGVRRSDGGTGASPNQSTVQLKKACERLKGCSLFSLLPRTWRRWIATNVSARPTTETYMATTSIKRTSYRAPMSRFWKRWVRGGLNPHGPEPLTHGSWAYFHKRTPPDG